MVRVEIPWTGGDIRCPDCTRNQGYNIGRETTGSANFKCFFCRASFEIVKTATAPSEEIINILRKHISA